MQVQTPFKKDHHLDGDDDDSSDDDMDDVADENLLVSCFLPLGSSKEHTNGDFDCDDDVILIFIMITIAG